MNQEELSQDTNPQEDKHEGYHQCPYCGQKHGQINDHFTHIEVFHPEENLI